MPDTIVGLDFGSTGLKAVCLRRGFRGLEWVAAVDKDWIPNENPLDGISGSNGSPPTAEGETGAAGFPESAVSIIRDTLGALSAGRATIVVSVPAHLCSIRTLDLPFSDERRIAQVVPFEVEPLLPLPLEEMVVDHQPLETAEDHCRLLVAAVPKRTLERILALLTQAGIDPAMVELDALALFTLTQYGPKFPESEGLAVVDVGASKTSVVVMDQGHPRFVRTFLSGSRHWAEAVGRTLSLPAPSAEDQMRRFGLDDGISQALTGPLSEWADELNRTLHVAQRECPHPLRSVVLCGGGARLRGIDRYVRDSLDLEVRRFEPTVSREKAVSWEGGWSLALGLALKAGGARKGSRINFRKGEFAFQEEIATTRRKAIWIWAGLGVLLALGAADLTIKYRMELARYESAKAELRDTFTRMFPEVKNVVDELQQAESSVEAMRKKLALFGRRDTGSIGVLGELTDRIPKEIQIEVRELSIEPDRVRLQAETSSFESVDRIKASVSESKMFSQAEVSNAKILSDKGGKVRFDLTLKLGPPGGKS